MLENLINKYCKVVYSEQGAVRALRGFLKGCENNFLILQRPRFHDSTYLALSTVISISQVKNEEVLK